MTRFFILFISLISINCNLPSASKSTVDSFRTTANVAEEQVAEATPEEIAAINIIPKPLSLTQNIGAFVLHNNTGIVAPNQADWLQAIAFLQNKIKIAAGFDIAVNEVAKKQNIVFEEDKTITNKEGYRLDISKNQIIIKASTANGAFYAIQTLRQLLPNDIEATKVTDRRWIIPCCTIVDEPRYTWRGMHLDVGRHFFTVDFLKKYIDLMAMHKFNRFHWHLTEDQGWRIEIKKYPRLTEVGGYRKGTLTGRHSDNPERYDGQAYGGFYTQEQIKEVVQYATERFVMVIPEIEMPGHSLAALAAYPELACDQGPFEAAMKWGVFRPVYCPKEETFTFLQDVLTEVMALFPSEYIHIGGDEVMKESWAESEFCQQLMEREKLSNEEELQSYFIRRIEKFLNSKGKKLIGWDEILEGGLSDNATVMSWRGTEGGISAARAHHDAIMSPGSHCYFDHYQVGTKAQKDKEPIAIGGFTSVKKVYSYDPTPEELSPEEAKHILGAQGNVWTEYIKTSTHVEYMVYPRAVALAEVVWTPQDDRIWREFQPRLLRHLGRLDVLGVNYAKHIMTPSVK